MTTLKKFLFRSANPDTGAGAPIDRGDELTPEPLVEPVVEVKDDPAVKALEEELVAEVGDKADGEGDPAGDVDTKPAKDTRIPAARHKEILEKERAKTAALAAEVAQLKQRGQLETAGADATAEFATLEAEIAALEEEYGTLLTDGEIKKATAVMAKIRTNERHMNEVKSDLKIQAAAARAAEASSFQAALGRIESAFPVLNPDHESFDAKTEARVARLNRANRAEGMTPVAALQDAVDTILGSDTPAQERAVAAPAAKPGAERKAEAVAKTVAAVAKTPASLGRVGQDSDKLGGKISAEAAIKLSQKAFSALSEADLSEMRGDTI